MALTFASSTPAQWDDAPGPLLPALFVARTTNVSSAVVATGFWTGCGRGSRPNTAGMRVGDILLHIASTDSATPGRCTIHTVIDSTADQASTAASSGWNAGYNATVASAT